ncbi:hypothetical protein [Streptomyces sp. NPDC002187]|uniref:hypothetical protein n=1 Tax=Streptomyces sp. NPDC002187 TaxID=3364637 RepID=UPI0036BAB6CC
MSGGTCAGRFLPLDCRAWRPKRNCGWAPGQLRIDYKVETSNKVGGTFGLSEGAVSAAVGFDVTETVGRTFGYTATLPKHAHYKLRAGEVYKEYRFDVYERRGELAAMGGLNIYCHAEENSWVKAGTSTAAQFCHRLTKGRMAR